MNFIYHNIRFGYRFCSGEQGPVQRLVSCVQLVPDVIQLLQRVLHGVVLADSPLDGWLRLLYFCLQGVEWNFYRLLKMKYGIKIWVRVNKKFTRWFMCHRKLLPVLLLEWEVKSPLGYLVRWRSFRGYTGLYPCRYCLAVCPRWPPLSVEF